VLKVGQTLVMHHKRQLVIGLLGSLLLSTLSCHKKTSARNVNLPGPAQAPTLTQTLPYEIQPEQAPALPPPTAQVEEQPEKHKQKPKSRPKTNAKKGAPTTPSSQVAANSAAPPPATAAPGNETATATLRPPGNPAEAATAVAIGPDVSSPQANRDRQSTNQLLDTTEKEVKVLDNRSLSSEEQGVLMQIKTYISQSRKALTDGDYERASNLARKAQLLADELIKK